MKAGTRAQARYLSKSGRKTLMILFTMLQGVKDYLPGANLKPKERQNIQRGVTLIYNELLRMGDTMEPRFWNKVLEECENVGIQIMDMRNEAKKDQEGWKNYYEDDVFDLADFALTGCEGCKKDFKSCRKYELLMKLDVPAAKEETDGCPYEQ